MLRSSLLALLLAFAVATQPAIAAIAVVQTATSNPGTAGRSPSITFGQAPANGDLLLMVISWASSTVTGNLPTGYTTISKNQSITGCYAQFSFWEFASGASATITFTNMLSASAMYSITGFDISGQSTVAPINASGNNGTSACGATHTVQPTATSTATNTLAVTFAVDDGTGTALTAPSNPYTAVQTFGAFNSTGHVGVYDQLFTGGAGSGSINPSWGTGTDAHGQVIVIAPFVASGPGAGSTMMMGCCK